jgi:hypothetical protein
MNGARLRWLAILTGACIVLAVLVPLLLTLPLFWMHCAPAIQRGQHPTTLGGCQLPPSTGLFQPTPAALAEIPQPVLQNYIGAGARYRVPWPVLAGIGKVECDHGRSTLRGCHSDANFAGAMGPMQFLKGTWEAFKVTGPGHLTPDVYDSSDAIYTAGNYLAHLGAANVIDLTSSVIHRAIFGYNHSDEYVSSVLDLAFRYGQIAPRGPRGGFGILGAVAQQITPLFPWVPQGGFPGAGLFNDSQDQCTYYAAFQWPGHNRRGVTWNGNAGDWLARARGQGYQVSPIPSVGAIAVWEPQPGYSQFGHVAVVTEVDSNSYTVSEQNFKGPGLINQRKIAWPDGRIGGFIPIPLDSI